eukprot:GILK01003239.1.p1 GENE.GILK01003239.1~~GILK01003239.1.p1  ORF type:complete len:525 (+),score=68.04 GILK01003239.1:101-1576(+)
MAQVSDLSLLEAGMYLYPSLTITSNHLRSDRLSKISAEAFRSSQAHICTLTLLFDDFEEKLVPSVRRLFSRLNGVSQLEIHLDVSVHAAIACIAECLPVLPALERLSIHSTGTFMSRRQNRSEVKFDWTSFAQWVSANSTLQKLRIFVKQNVPKLDLVALQVLLLGCGRNSSIRDLDLPFTNEIEIAAGTERYAIDYVRSLTELLIRNRTLHTIRVPIISQNGSADGNNNLNSLLTFLPFPARTPRCKADVYLGGYGLELQLAKLEDNFKVFHFSSSLYSYLIRWCLCRCKLATVRIQDPTFLMELSQDIAFASGDYVDSSDDKQQELTDNMIKTLKSVLRYGDGVTDVTLVISKRWRMHKESILESLGDKLLPPRPKSSLSLSPLALSPDSSPITNNPRSPSLTRRSTVRFSVSLPSFDSPTSPLLRRSKSMLPPTYLKPPPLGLQYLVLSCCRYEQSSLRLLRQERRPFEVIFGLLGSEINLSLSASLD